ncbi:MAG: hypothetical protein US74_C0020G0016 [Parcubacteria group bacterium GW2011_GWA2_38_13]|nr:MAG: hypothetical protein US74_C0020G0016 [Parcubacteria group bacterium GW2011_GWA2_38_13]
MNPTIAYSKKNEKFFLIAIVFLLFIATRMYWMFSREFWYDEVFTAMIIKEPWDVMLTHIRQDVHPPLYYIALKVWTYATGINNIGLRSFSVFCNALNIFALYIFLKKYFSDKLLTHFLIILIALNPLFILYSTEARMYAMLSLFYFLAVYCFLQASKDPKKIAPWILFIIFYTLSIYTHYIALFGIIPFFLYIVFIKDKIANLYKLYVSSLIGFLVFSPWLPIFLQQKNSNPNGLLWLTLPGIHSLIKTLLVMIFGSRGATPGIAQVNDYYFLQWPQWAIYVNACIVVFLCVFIIYNYKKYKHLALFFLFSFIPIAIIFAIAKIQHLSIYHERYFIIFVPFFIIFLFSALYAAVGKKIFIAIAIMYCVAIALIKIPSSNSIAPLAMHISELYSDKQIIATDPNQFIMLKYYLPDNMDKNVRLYNAQNPSNDFTSWIIIQNSDRIFSFPKRVENAIIVSQSKEFLNTQFPDVEVFKINNYYYSK